MRFLSDFICRRRFNKEITMTDSQKLLAEYVETGSEPAFRELVTRYLDLVYSAAVRLMEGDTHRAEDVAQTVFADLARMARTLSREVMLGGWLHRHTCHVAATVLRGERRRQSRERQAVAMNALPDHSKANLAQIAPILDEAINQLGVDDRTAIVLRFFEQSDFRTIGHALGTNDDAAQKRVTRALEKLHSLMRHRGVSFSAAVLGTALATEAVTAAPAGLAISISGAALASAAVTGGTTLSLLKIIAMTKLKLGIISAIAVAAVATPLTIQYQTQARLRAENTSLRRQNDELAQRAAANERLFVAPANHPQELGPKELSELLRLRSEVGRLRRENKDLEKMQAENQRLHSLPASANAAPKAQNASVNDDLPKASLAFAGYADPESALQSTFWAINQGEAKTFRDSLASGSDMSKAAEGKTDDEFVAKVKSEFDKVTAFKILDKQVLSDDEVNLTVFAAGINQTAIFKMKRVGGQWKFAGRE
ncbi:MAG TPA: sigma-70 family RNA polymerase sigma factor [Verrucomicrobiae bacterium]|nr:sigma-70 family RNA polymerase sigma factor [Verrucomicrobiae bacterium]